MHVYLLKVKCLFQITLSVGTQRKGCGALSRISILGLCCFVLEDSLWCRNMQLLCTCNELYCTECNCWFNDYNDIIKQ